MEMSWFDDEQEFREVYHQALVRRFRDMVGRKSTTQGQVAGMYALLLKVLQPYGAAKVWKDVGRLVKDRWPKGYVRIKEMAWEMVDMLDDAYDDALAVGDPDADEGGDDGEFQGSAGAVRNCG